MAKSYTWDELQEMQVVVNRHHALVDEKGRRVGGYVVVHPFYDYVSDGDRYVLTGEWGTCLRAMRNWQTYGAGHGSKRHASKEVALAAAPALLDAQAKRYRKKYC